MFLDFLKEFFLKRKLKNSFSNVKNEASVQKVQRVGLLLDETYFDRREALVAELEKHGIERKNIDVLGYRPRIRKNEQFDYPVFSLKDVNWTGVLESEAVKKFTLQPFDLLISYYDVEKAPLMMVTQLSKAGFKSGFSTIDKRLNHLTVTTTAEQYTVFADELFRYLKILNKI